MKKFFALLCAAALVCLVSCEKEKDKGKKPKEPVNFGLLTPIKLPIEENAAKSGSRYSSEYIYKNVAWVNYHDMHPWDEDNLVDPTADCMVLMAGETAYYQFRDTIEKKLAMRRDLAIESRDGIHPMNPGDFAYWRDIVFVFALYKDGSGIVELLPDDPRRFNEEGSDGKFDIIHSDTVAYIPNALMDSMQPLMEKAFYDQDWDRCYDLFENGYKIYPITAEEYRELVRAGKN